MIQSYLPVLVLLVMAIVTPFAITILTMVLGPKAKSLVKGQAYECGVEAVGSARHPFAVHFYKIAILSLLFDVEAALLFPWAVLVKSKLPEWGAVFLVGELVLFLATLVAGYAYAWKRGALEWE